MIIFLLSFLLLVSFTLNCFIAWYGYRLLRNMVEITDNFDEMRTKLIEFATHLRAINKVESYYGDPTITALVRHMKQLANEIEEYAQIIVIYEDDLEEDINDNQPEEETI